MVTRILAMGSIQFTGINHSACVRFCKKLKIVNGVIEVPTPSGMVKCEKNSWVVKNCYNQFFIVTDKEYKDSVILL